MHVMTVVTVALVVVMILGVIDWFRDRDRGGRGIRGRVIVVVAAVPLIVIGVAGLLG